MGRVFSIGMLLMTPALALSADWPGWRGPGNSGVSPEKNLPVKWSAEENVAWKVPVAGAGVSAPVISGDHVFLTASNGRHQTKLHVYCFHREDGKQLWHSKLFGSAIPEWYFGPGGMAVPTPVTDGKHLFVLFGTGDLACLDFDGKPVWIRSLAQEYGPFRNRWGMAASPILIGDMLVVLVDHWGQSYLLAVHKQSGKNRWKTNRAAAVNWSSPFAVKVKDQTQIVVTGTYQVKGYAASDGKELWSFQGMQEQCIPTPVAHGDKVFAVSGRKGDTLAIQLDKSKGDIAWQSKRGTPNIPSPICYAGYYFLVDDQGIGTCLEVAGGKEIWRQRIGGKHQASPVAGAGNLYFTNVDGIVTVVKAGPKFEILARNRLDETIVASPAISSGQIFLRGEKHLYCVGAK